MLREDPDETYCWAVVNDHGFVTKYFPNFPNRPDWCPLPLTLEPAQPKISVELTKGEWEIAINRMLPCQGEAVAILDKILEKVNNAQSS
jgi:hypothetical protein